MEFGEFRSRWAPRAQNALFFLAESMVFSASNHELFTVFLKSANSYGNSVISRKFNVKRKGNHLKSSFSARAQNGLFSLAKS